MNNGKKFFNPENETPGFCLFHVGGQHQPIRHHQFKIIPIARGKGGSGGSGAGTKALASSPTVLIGT
jgi:hypothetical protein